MAETQEKPTIAELEKILSEAPGTIEIQPDGSIKTIDPSSEFQDGYAKGIATERERCAKICEKEKDARNHRANNPLPGDDLIDPFSQEMVQISKSLTAGFLADAIRSHESQDSIETKEPS